MGAVGDVGGRLAAVFVMTSDPPSKSSGMRLAKR